MGMTDEDEGEEVKNEDGIGGEMGMTEKDDGGGQG